MKKLNLRENKGISMTDIIIAIVILSMFVGLIGSLYYNIAYSNNSIRMDATAVYYAIKIAEATDKMTYEEVEETLNETLEEKYNLPENINATIQVKKYNEDDNTKLDIIKKLTIKIDYTFMNDSKSFELEKLKIKEQ